MALSSPPKRDIWFRNRLLRDAIGQAIYDEMKVGPNIHLFGEGAHMKVHFDAPQIEADFSERIHTMPISEDGNMNFAVGASLAGVKPVVDVIAGDFFYRCMDSIANTASKLNVMRPGEEPRTIVIRGEVMIGGPTTGQRPEAIFAHMPGVNVMLPSTPRDAYRMMREALNNPGVTVFFEDRMVKDSDVKNDDAWDVPQHEPALRRYKSRAALTIASYGVCRQIVENALDRYDLRAINVFDLMYLYPLGDLWPLVEDTRNLLIVEPDIVYGGIGAEIVAKVAERFPGAIVKRLGAPRETITANYDDHYKYLPSEEEVIRATRSF